jgi:hypothetical protein
MRITNEFIEKLKEQRNLQSIITNSSILARTIQELQADMAEAKLRLGMPDKNESQE